MCWHPDRNQFFNAAKDFRNGSDYCLRGWDVTDTNPVGVPAPDAELFDTVNVKEPATDHPGTMVGRLMDVASTATTCKSPRCA